MRWFPLLLMGWLMPGFAGATLAVLYDSGDTLPLAPLLKASGFDEEEEVRALPPNTPPPEVVSQRRMTVRSPSLSPGVQPRIPVGKAGTMLPRPIFLVGADPASLAWLQEHRAHLLAIGAVGLVVEVSGEAGMKRVLDAAGGLPLAAGSAEMLASQFGLQHYPVLIGPEWIEQ